MAVADCLEMLLVDVDDEIQGRLDEEMDEEIERIWGFSDKSEVGWFDLE